MTSYEAGAIVLLAFSFSDSLRAKQHPDIVLLDYGDPDLMLARVTSRDASDACDVVLTLWREAGLLLPSTVRLHKLATLRLVKRTLSRLHDEDWRAVRSKLVTLWEGCRDG